MHINEVHGSYQLGDFFTDICNSGDSWTSPACWFLELIRKSYLHAYFISLAVRWCRKKLLRYKKDTQPVQNVTLVLNADSFFSKYIYISAAIKTVNVNAYNRMQFRFLLQPASGGKNPFHWWQIESVSPWIYFLCNRSKKQLHHTIILILAKRR